jgi:acyl-CoA synthetase (AMP-forming)/AMP-acid ligase II
VTSPLDVFEPGYDVKVVDEAGHPVADGEVSEILVRGSTVTRQLIKVRHADVFDADGFFRTGDRGLRDGGRIHFVGRLGDMIKTAGANVAPPEVERELVRLDGVEDAFVTGIDHPTRGQQVVAAVIWEGDTAFDAGPCRASCRTAFSLQGPASDRWRHLGADTHETIAEGGPLCTCGLDRAVVRCLHLEPTRGGP